MYADIQWDNQLIKRYGHAATACSSYSLVSQFQPGFAALDLLRVLRNRRQPLQLAVSLPPTQCHALDRYLDCLEREMELLSCHISPGQSVRRLHLGCGVLSAEQLRRLLACIRKRFNVHASAFAEDSVEVSPTHADWVSMGVLHELGFRHVSIRVPDASAAAAGVVVDFRDAYKIRWLIEAARALRFTSVNVDLGYGRAWQSLASFRNKVAAIIELQPSRVLLFDYAHPPQHYQAIQRFGVRGFAAACDKQAMHQHAVERLLAAGYCYIGLGQFALEDDALVSACEGDRLRRNWLGYSREPCADVLGLGVGAISQIGTLQLQNRHDLGSYQAQLTNGQLAVFYGHQRSTREQLQWMLSEALLCDFHVDLQAFEARFGALFNDYFAARQPVLAQMAADGLLQLNARTLSILPAGRLLVGAVCKVLEQGRGEAQLPRWRTAQLSAVC